MTPRPSGGCQPSLPLEPHLWRCVRAPGGWWLLLLDTYWMILIYAYTILYHPICWLYHSISTITILLWCHKSLIECVCVWKALNQRVSAGGHPCHHWWMANKEANDESCKRTCEFLTSDTARWLSHKPPMPTWHDNITWHDFISSHFILSLRGVSKCVFHEPGSLIKCRGSLVVRPPRIPDYFQNFPDIMLPEADSAQASRCCLSEFSSRSRVLQKSPDYISEFASIQIFHPQISTCHARFMLT